jgi:Na+-translocating ferredoxin:NAD+ oxidoreductase RnfE subunit
VWVGVDELVLSPSEDEVAVFRCFLKAGVRFPLHKTVVAVLKRFNIYLHQLTPNAIVCLGIFIWVVRSQGIKLDAEAFCEAFSHIHELHF